ncbi:MAG: cobyric acid synthase [Acidobacteria bacterium]|nr:cobyric acid synthase [Acidobacteriota bacterium]
MAAQALLVAGTASHVGKSWMATAICRSLARRGVKVAPFKAQNMSHNSFPCVGGGEIGRAQVAQAAACGLAPHPDMNPILLKPMSDRGSQVVVQGKVWRDLTAAEYYEQHKYLAGKVEESFERLAARYEFIVAEGAGSIAELNLAKTDLVNMGFATRFDVPVLLVADIDRGGVFGALHGTIDLLTADQRKLVRAFAVNRFRGGPQLFESGRQLLEEKTGKPCLGVFPHAPEIHLDEEDGVGLEGGRGPSEVEHPVAILRFPRISNFGDFRLLRSAQWIEEPLNRDFHTLILPGTKNTAVDLQWMRSRGLDQWVLDQHERGARVLGICGGYQMLGERIDDPLAVESDLRSVIGLGLLPVVTVMAAEKTTERVAATTLKGVPFPAYEIHMGQTERPSGGEPLAWVAGRPEGMRLGRVAGSYLHGALENPDVAEEWLGFRPGEAASKEASYDLLADWFEDSADPRVLAKLLPGW